MKIFEVPQETTQVHVTLLGGEELDGSLFFAERGPGGAPGKLTDRLNDPAERFVPLSAGGQGRLLNKARVLTVHAAEAAAAASVEPDHPAVAVRLRLLDELVVEGWLAFAMPPGRGRLLDYLNAAPDFIPVRVTDGIKLINRDAIVSVENVKPKPGE